MVKIMICLFVDCLTFQQHASVSHGRMKIMKIMTIKVMVDMMMTCCRILWVCGELTIYGVDVGTISQETTGMADTVTGLSNEELPKGL